MQRIAIAVRPDRTSSVEDLLERTRAHIAQQDAWLAKCRRLLGVLDDRAARFVTEHLVESRLAHRRLLVQLATSLHDSLHWTESEQALPCPQPGAAAPRARYGLGRVTELIRAERALARSSRQLAGAFSDVAWGMDALLLGAMAHDSQKHDRVLRFVRRLLKSQLRHEDGPDGEPAERRILVGITELVREPVAAPEPAWAPSARAAS